MAVDPSGSISLAEEAGVDLLANLAAFRSLLGVDTIEAAKAKCFNDEIPSGTDRPHVLHYLDPDGPGFETERVAEFQWVQTGVWRAILERDVPEAHQDNVEDAERDFKNRLGAIVEEVYEKAGAAGYMNAVRVRVFGPWRFTTDYEESALGQIQAAGLEITWES